ncbi:MAG: hypothetical protein ACLFOC_09025 [Campylobacterales bacterium]
MRSVLHTAFVTILVLVLMGCSGRDDRAITISLNNWIGYYPLYYIDEKAWMDNEIEFRKVTSLMESLKMFQAGLSDGFCGTQYEYEHSNIIKRSTVPVILLDRSDGGDVILSNIEIEEIKTTDKKIDVYLETQSVNSSLFNSFLQEYELSKSKFNLINTNQQSISNMPLNEEPKIFVTYEPYASTLLHTGYKKIASTKNMNLLVIDGLFLKESIAQDRRETLQKLKANIIKALNILENNPQEFYSTIKPYLQGQSFEEFKKSLGTIEWIVNNRNKAMQDALKKHNIPQQWLVK